MERPVCIVRRGAVGARVCECFVVKMLYVVSYVHPEAVLNAAFCMTCSLLMQVEYAIGTHTEEAYSRAGFLTSL